MENKSILYKKSIVLQNGIEINIPYVGEVLDNEDSYFGLVHLLTSSPMQYMVQLDDIGVDYSAITSYEMFLIFAPFYFNSFDTSIVFKNLNANDFCICRNEKNDTNILYSPSLDIEIDELGYMEIAKTLRYLNMKELDKRKVANDNAKEYLLEKERTRLKRLERKRKKIEYMYQSSFENIIVGMVNNKDFKYDYEGVKNLTIYQFYKSFKQLQTNINFENTMRGIYAGTLDMAKLKDRSSLSWLISSDN